MKKENINLEMPESTEVIETSEATTLTVLKSDVAPATLIDSLKNANNELFCSIINDGSRKSKARIYNAIQGDHEELTKHVNEVLEIIDVVAYPITVTNDNGEISDILRTILIDKTGKGYTAGSIGITNSLSKIFAIVGSPENGAWHEEPVKMICRTKSSRNNATYSFNFLELVEE